MQKVNAKYQLCAAVNAKANFSRLRNTHSQHRNEDSRYGEQKNTLIQNTKLRNTQLQMHKYLNTKYTLGNINRKAQIRNIHHDREPQIEMKRTVCNSRSIVSIAGG